MKTLLLMRHAKSDWDADYGSDHERPLNERGLRSARLMGRVLAKEGLVPDLIISSTAVRARKTAELAIEAGGWNSEMRLDRSLYDEGPRGVLAVGASASDVDGLMLVGHQPTWAMLVSALTGERAEMKTAAVAVIEMDIESWADLPDASGTLTRVLEPRAHEQT